MADRFLDKFINKLPEFSQDMSLPDCMISDGHAQYIANRFLESSEKDSAKNEGLLATLIYKTLTARKKGLAMLQRRLPSIFGSLSPFDIFSIDKNRIGFIYCSHNYYDDNVVNKMFSINFIVFDKRRIAQARKITLLSFSKHALIRLLQRGNLSRFGTGDEISVKLFSKFMLSISCAYLLLGDFSSDQVFVESSVGRLVVKNDTVVTILPNEDHPVLNFDKRTIKDLYVSKYDSTDLSSLQSVFGSTYQSTAKVVNENNEIQRSLA